MRIDEPNLLGGQLTQMGATEEEAHDVLTAIEEAPEGESIVVVYTTCAGSPGKWTVHVVGGIPLMPVFTPAGHTTY
jgi:hypothetical protein